MSENAHGCDHGASDRGWTLSSKLGQACIQAGLGGFGARPEVKEDFLLLVRISVSSRML